MNLVLRASAEIFQKLGDWTEQRLHFQSCMLKRFSPSYTSTWKQLPGFVGLSPRQQPGKQTCIFARGSIVPEPPAQPPALAHAWLCPRVHTDLLPQPSSRVKPGHVFQQNFLFFWGFIIDVTMVPTFSSGLKSKECRCSQIKEIFQLQTRSTKGHWLFLFLVFIYYICAEGQVLIMLHSPQISSTYSTASQ